MIQRPWRLHYRRRRGGSGVAKTEPTLVMGKRHLLHTLTPVMDGRSGTVTPARNNNILHAATSKGGRE
ncbi:hypothetical protein E2C01_004097 [Portunus trituberculatus]|uniref:Uncharacterized protein n=1 Tax=Portunus trituberculatus TaxID=210409 RepID=A0A5B7CRH9_PORTR|nr:hypothetical protein [Portunus trituberculatus]